jgi:hypothetical protein
MEQIRRNQMLHKSLMYPFQKSGRQKTKTV